METTTHELRWRKIQSQKVRPSLNCFFCYVVCLLGKRKKRKKIKILQRFFSFDLPQYLVEVLTAGTASSLLGWWHKLSTPEWNNNNCILQFLFKDKQFNIFPKRGRILLTQQQPDQLCTDWLKTYLGLKSTTSLCFVYFAQTFGVSWAVFDDKPIILSTQQPFNYAHFRPVTAISSFCPFHSQY